jgi:hypothetical protein
MGTTACFAKWVLSIVTVGVKIVEIDLPNVFKRKFKCILDSCIENSKALFVDAGGARRSEADSSRVHNGFELIE